MDVSEVPESVEQQLELKLKEIEDIFIQSGLTDDPLVTCIVRDGADKLRLACYSNEDAPIAMLAAFLHLSGTTNEDYGDLCNREK